MSFRCPIGATPGKFVAISWPQVQKRASRIKRNVPPPPALTLAVSRTCLRCRWWGVEIVAVDPKIVDDENLEHILRNKSCAAIRTSHILNTDSSKNGRCRPRKLSFHLRLAAELCTFVTTATSQPVIQSTGSLVICISPTCPMFAPTCTIIDPNFPQLAPT